MPNTTPYSPTWRRARSVTRITGSSGRANSLLGGRAEWPRRTDTTWHSAELEPSTKRSAIPRRWQSSHGAAHDRTVARRTKRVGYSGRELRRLCPGSEIRVRTGIVVACATRRSPSGGGEYASFHDLAARFHLRRKREGELCG